MNKATLKKQNRLIATIQGEHKEVRKFIYDNLKLYDLVPAVDDQADWNEGYSDRWVNGDVVLQFKLRMFKQPAKERTNRAEIKK